MLLAIDTGNTNISFGLFQQDTLVRTWRIATDRHKTDDEYSVILQHLFHRDQISPGQVDAVALCTVVPSLRDVFVQVSRRLFGLTPWILEPQHARLPLALMVDYPAEVGADRIAASVAAYELYGSPLIVIDFGTATTFDCVNEQGQYLGGAIAPGVEISAEALSFRTAKLPRVELAAPPAAIGRNTNHALRSGIIFGYAAMVEGLVARMAAELGTRPKIVGTGGLCGIIAEQTQVIQHVRPTLVLEGLRSLYFLNTGAAGGDRPVGENPRGDTHRPWEKGGTRHD